MFSIIKRLAIVTAVIILLGGCSTMYPRLLDDPAVIQAAAECIRESNKTWQASGSITNPDVQFYYIIGVGAKMTGVDGRIGAQGASGPTTQPVE